MGFDSGAVSFRRFSVVGKAPAQLDQPVLDALAEHALRPTETGVPDEVEYGWSGGRHILDGTFSFENNVFVDALHIGLRVDTNRVPPEIKKAYQLIEEEATAAGNPSGFISKLQKKEVKDVVRRKVDDELRSGRYRRSKLTSVLWDLPSGMVYSPCSAATEEKLRELFERTFGLALEPVSSGSLATRILESRGRRRDAEDARPTRFAPGPEGDQQMPDYPWVAKAAEAHDYFGNEFVLWLWHEAQRKEGYIALGDTGEAAVMFDRSLDLDCAYASTGKTSLRATGPAKMPEAIEALRTGKVPRRCGLTIDYAGSQYTFSLNAETLAVSGLKLPEIPDADTPRVLFEERIAQLRDFNRLIDALFGQFLTVRASSAWEGASSGIRRWITAPKIGVRQHAMVTA